nr:hypothetical protein [Tanacetum cinerariifolium]
SSFAVLVFSYGDYPIACLNKAMAFLTVVASSSGVTVQQVQGRQGQNYSGTTYNGKATSSRGNTTSGPERVVKCYNYQGEGHMDTQCTQPKRQRNDAWYKEKAMLAEAQKAGQILDEEQLVFHTDPRILVGQVQTIIPHNDAFPTEDLGTYDFDYDDLSNAQAVLMATFPTMVLKLSQSAHVTKATSFYDDTHKQALGYQNLFYLKKAQRIKTTLHDGRVISNQHVASHMFDDEETLILEERSESCEKCLNLDAEFSKSKQAYNDLLKKYSQLEKHCISLEVSMQLKQEVFQNDESCVYQNASEIPEYFEKNDLKAQLKDKDTTIYKLKDTIKSLRKNTKEEIVDKCDLATINEELENSVAKLLSENECRCKEINHVKQIFKDQFDPIKQTRVLQKEQRDSLINKQDLKAQIQDKVFVITSLRNDLRKLKGKATVDNVAQIPYATTVVPKMFKLDLKPLVPKLMHNKENNELDFACKHAKRIQELLAYVHDTCLSAIRLSEIKVARTPMNKIKKVTFVKPIASSSTNQETHDSNKPMLHSTGVKCSTSASRSKLSGNTKNNRISQPSHSNKINKVEDQPRSVKTRKNNNDRVKKVKCDDHVMQSMSNANSVSVSINNAPVKNSMNDSKSGCLCAICGKCMIAKTHHECVQFVVTNMNESKKSKSTKKHKKQNVWKPTGHVFTEVGLKWKPTGRTFTIVGNSCPLIRFTSTNIVPPKKPTSYSDEIQKPEIKVVQIVLWYLDSGCSKHMTGYHSQLMNFVSKYLDTVKFGNDQITRTMGYGDYQLGNVVISRVYYVEGFGHNLFSVGQFCDADLEVAF